MLARDDQCPANVLKHRDVRAPAQGWRHRVDGISDEHNVGGNSSVQGTLVYMSRERRQPDRLRRRSPRLRVGQVARHASRYLLKLSP